MITVKSLKKSGFNHHTGKPLYRKKFSFDIERFAHQIWPLFAPKLVKKNVLF